MIVEEIKKQNFWGQLKFRLASKQAEHATYKKALGILDSILQSSKQIPNFQVDYSESDSNLALFTFGTVYKLLSKLQQSKEHNIESYLLLMNLSFPQVNFSILKQVEMISSLQKTLFRILSIKEKSTFSIRLIFSLLTTIMLQESNLANNNQSIELVSKIFQQAITLPRNNPVAKYSSKMLSKIVKKYPFIGNTIAQKTKNYMFKGLQNRRELYLNNIKEVVREFPLRIINDIAYRVAKNLGQIDHNNINSQLYLCQSYYFVQSVIDKLSSDTIEQILKELIDNVPTCSKSEKIIHFYLQTLYQIIYALAQHSDHAINPYLSSVVSIFQEFILQTQNVERQAANLLGSILGNCLKRSLWKQTQRENNIDIQGINLEENERNCFVKLVCMLRSMLSARYQNKEITCTILCKFFQSVDTDAIELTLELIQHCIDFKDQFGPKLFQKLMHAIMGSMGVGKLLQIYRLNIVGDISGQTFQTQNNLWMLACLEKYEGEEQLHYFATFIYPCAESIKNLLTNQELPKLRLEAYKVIYAQIWRCFKIFTRKINKNDDFDGLFNNLSTQMAKVAQNTQQHIAVGLQILCINLFRLEYQTPYAQKLIKTIVGLLKLGKNNTKQFLKTIRALSLIAEKIYLNRVFERNIFKLVQAAEAGVLHENQENNLKNLQILIAISAGINFNDPTVFSELKLSKEELVLRLVTKLLTSQNIFQKKAYKYIALIVGAMPPSFVGEIIDLLDSSNHKVMHFSKYYRLNILLQLWKRLSPQDFEKIFSFIKDYLPEVLIALKENNKRTRRKAEQLFRLFYEVMDELGIIKEFIQIICAGLASSQVQIKIATVTGLTHILSYKEYFSDFQFTNQIVQLVLYLLSQTKDELFRIIIQFCKQTLSIFSLKDQKILLKKILNSIFESQQTIRLNNRSLLKFFLTKMSKKHGKDIVQQMIPLKDRKILSNALKLETQAKKKKKKLQRQRLNKSIRNDSSQSNEQDHNIIQTQKNDMEIQHDAKLKKLNDTDNLLLKYDLEKETFHFEKQKLSILKQEKQARKKNATKDNDIVFTEDGIMIIKDQTRFKRQSKTEQREQEVEQPSKLFSNNKKRLKPQTIHLVKQSGETYKSAKAKGDIKLKDKPEPYAFIQLNSKSLNKRFKKKAQKVFDSIFERKSGGLKGLKSKVSNSFK